MDLQSQTLNRIGIRVESDNKFQLLKDADFDFGVVERDLYYLGELHKGFKRLENRKVLLRSDNYSVLGLPKENYSTVTMTEALNLFDPFVEEGHLSYEYAGTSTNSKGQGLKFWVLLRLNEEYYEVTKGDYILPYLLVSNSFDGSCGLWIRSTGVRFFCDNQVHLLIKENGDRIYVKHTGRAKDRFIAKGKEFLTQLLLNNRKTVEAFQKMNETQIEDGVFEDYLKKVFPDRYKEDKQWSNHQTLLTDFGNGDEFCNGDTVYSAYNAITALLTHDLGSDDKYRFFSNHWGSNASYGNRAFNLAMSMVE